jgi:hypothetical protein
VATSDLNLIIKVLRQHRTVRIVSTYKITSYYDMFIFFVAQQHNSGLGRLVLGF